MTSAEQEIIDSLSRIESNTSGSSWNASIIFLLLWVFTISYFNGCNEDQSKLGLPVRIVEYNQ